MTIAKKHSKRVISAFLVLAIVISAFTGLFSTSAVKNEEDYKIYDNVKKIENKSLVSKDPAVLMHKEQKDTDVILDDAEYIYDEDLETEAKLPNYDDIYQFFDLKEGCSLEDKSADAIGTIYDDGSLRYQQFTLELNGVANVSDIVVGNSLEKVLRTYRYDLYASSSLDDLYDEANKVAEYVNEDSKQVQDFHFADGKELQAVQYVGMRVCAPVNFNNLSALEDIIADKGVGYLVTRILEFNVYGVTVNTAADVKSDDEDEIPEGTSVVESVSGGAFQQGAQKTEFDPIDIKLLTDGKADEEFAPDGEANNEDLFVDSKDEVKKDYSHNFIFKIKNGFDVKKLVVLNADEKAERTYKYDVFMCDSNADTSLFKSENKVTTFVNKDNNLRQIFTFNGGRGFVKKYLGVSVTAAMDDYDSYVDENTFEETVSRFNEMAVLGDEVKEETAETIEELTDIPETKDAGDEMPKGKNILEGVTCDVTTYDDSTGDIAVHDGSISVYKTSYKNLTDGKTDTMFSAGADRSTGPVYNDDGTKQLVDEHNFPIYKHNAVTFLGWNEKKNTWKMKTDGTVHTDMTFGLDGEAEVKQLYVCHHKTKANRTVSYKVYASDNAADLFTKENLVKDFENKKSFRANLLTFDEPIKGVRYLGIRVTNPITDPDTVLKAIQKHTQLENGEHKAFATFSEVAAIGSIKPDDIGSATVIKTDNTKIPDVIDTKSQDNLSKNFTVKGQMYDTSTKKSYQIEPAASSALTDENNLTQCSFSNNFAEYKNGKANYYNIHKRYYMDLFYNLKSEAAVSSIVIANHFTRELVTGKYEVYLGDDKDTLYDGEPYTTVDNIADYDLGKPIHMNIIRFVDDDGNPTTYKAKYVGIRIYNPVCKTGEGATEVTEYKNNITTKLYQFAVYGKYTDKDFDPAADAGYTPVDDLDKLEEISKHDNLLVGQKPRAKVNGKSFDLKSSGYEEKLSTLVDSGNVNATHIDFSINEFDDDVVDVYYKISDKWDLTKIKALAFRGISSKNSEPYYTAKFKIFLSEDMDGLFAPENCIVDYDANDDDNLIPGVICDEKNNSILKNGKNAAYIAFRIEKCYYSATEWLYPRLSLLYCWGEQAVIEGKPDNLAENMPIDAYFVNGGKKTYVSDSDLTPAEVKNMTDSDESTSATITTSGADQKHLEVLYNLCGDMVIDDMWLSTVVNSTQGFGKLKVYAAKDLPSVNSEGSKVWETTPSGSGTVKPSFSSKVTARYVRLVFEDTKDEVVINEIYMNGLDNQKNKTKKLSGTLEPSADFTVTRDNYKEKSSKIVSMLSSLYGTLNDGDTSTYLKLYGGTVGKDNYSILMNMNELKTVSSIKIDFLKDFEDYWPTKGNIYIGETKDDVYKEGVKVTPTASFTLADVKDNVYQLDLKPTLARFVRVEFTDFVKKDYYMNDEGEYDICAAIPEITITGTKVKGLQTDDEDDSLLNFKTNVKGFGDATVTIVRLDLNDVFTDVSSVKLIPEAPTNRQKDSLDASPYYKIYKDKNLKIVFYDANGKVVKNIGGRKVRVTLKKPSGYAVNETYIGDATNRVKVEQMDTVDANGNLTATINFVTGKDNKVNILCLTDGKDKYWNRKNWKNKGKLENFPECKEENEDSDTEEHDEEWYKSIRTTDGRFIVTPFEKEIRTGVKFTATDVSKTASDAEYKAVLEQADGKKVAVMYDFKLTYKGKKYKFNDAMNIVYKVPKFVSDNFTDLQVVHLSSNGEAEVLYSEENSMDYGEGTLYFETDSFSKFAVIGTANDGSSSLGDGTEGNPDTGENAMGLFMAFGLLLAAGFISVKCFKSK